MKFQIRKLYFPPDSPVPVVLVLETVGAAPTLAKATPLPQPVIFFDVQELSPQFPCLFIQTP